MLNYSNGMEETMKSSVFKERRKNLADLILNNELYVPMKTKEIAILLGIPKELRHELQEVLDSLVADGTIGVSKKGKYMKPDNVALVGTFESTSRGFGFVVVDGQDDVQSEISLKLLISCGVTGKSVFKPAVHGKVPPRSPFNCGSAIHFFAGKVCFKSFGSCHFGNFTHSTAPSLRIELFGRAEKCSYVVPRGFRRNIAA